jgi:hypothetical protein
MKLNLNIINQQLILVILVYKTTILKTIMSLINFKGTIEFSNSKNKFLIKQLHRKNYLYNIMYISQNM